MVFLPSLISTLSNQTVLFCFPMNTAGGKRPPAVRIPQDPYYFMMPGSKGLSPHELAHRWVKDLRTRPDMSIKVG